MSNQCEIRIISNNSIINGEITIVIIPHDDYGNEYDEVPEQPNELINLSSKVNIIRNIPDDFFKGFYNLNINLFMINLSIKLKNLILKEILFLILIKLSNN